MKIAFCFPGQGSQGVGMGSAIAAQFPAARAAYDEASEAVGFGVAKLCFEGSLDDLTRTELQQPALVATSIACLRAVQTLGIEPAYVIGHSVGEYSALAAAGAIGTGDAVALVRERGEAMAEAALETPGAMAAVLGLDDTVVEELCRSIDGVWPANYNCPGQVVVSGANSAVDRLIEQAAGLGARKVVKLRVSGAFHSPLVARAAERLKPALARATWRNPSPPFMSTVTA
jgi:[acyl-carrier-protein] S-malonyltransferase